MTTMRDMYETFESKLFRIQSRLDRMPPNKSITLNPSDTQVLLADTYYRKSSGLGPGTHYRKRRGEGCFHLRVQEDGSSFLHWDRWDPDLHPVKHFFEASEFVVKTCVANVRDTLKTFFKGLK
jgi:hypothetical protein